MAVPTLSSVQPAVGPSTGGDLVRLVGTGFTDRVQVLFGGTLAEVLSVRDEAGLRVVDVRTPPHGAGVVDLELTNQDASGARVAGETVGLARAYRFARSTVARSAAGQSAVISTLGPRKAPLPTCARAARATSSPR